MDAMTNKPTTQANALTSTATARPNVFKRIWLFYFNGFRGMSRTGRTLWLIILVKLFVMFAILRLFLFPNFLKQQADTPEGKAGYVQEQLVNRGV